jgi:hypothetical protein
LKIESQKRESQILHQKELASKKVTKNVTDYMDSRSIHAFTPVVHINSWNLFDDLEVGGELMRLTAGNPLCHSSAKPPAESSFSNSHTTYRQLP